MFRNQKVSRQSIILGIYFMLTYTTYVSFSFIVTFIAQEDGSSQYPYAPTVALIVNYSTYLITLVFSPCIQRYKLMFQISALCHSFNYAVYILEWQYEWGLLLGVVGAVFGGYGAAIYWVSQGGFMMKLFEIYKIQKNEQGGYFGMVNGIVYGSNLFGAIITTFGLGLFGNQIYFIILTFFGILSWVVCTVGLDDLKQIKLEREEGVSLISQSQSIQLSSKKSSLMDFQLAKKTLIKVIKFYPKMIYMIIPFILDGFITGFISTDLSNLIPTQIRNSIHVGIVLMILGIGCIIGAVLSGYLSDKFEVPNVGKSCFIIILIILTLTLVTKIYTFQQLYFYALLGLLWGFGLNYLESWMSVCCAKIYEGTLQSFSIMRQIQAISFISFEIYLIISGHEIDVAICMTIIGFLCIISCFGMVKLQQQVQKNTFKLLNNY